MKKKKHIIILIIILAVGMASFLSCLIAYLKSPYSLKNGEIRETPYRFEVIKNELSEVSLNVEIRVNSSESFDFGIFGVINKYAAILNLSYENNESHVQLVGGKLGYDADDTFTYHDFNLNDNAEKIYRESFFAEPDCVSIKGYKSKEQERLNLIFVSGLKANGDCNKELIYVINEETGAILFVAELKIDENYCFPADIREKNYISVVSFAAKE